MLSSGAEKVSALLTGKKPSEAVVSAPSGYAARRALMTTGDAFLSAAMCKGILPSSSFNAAAAGVIKGRTVASGFRFLTASGRESAPSLTFFLEPPPPKSGMAGDEKAADSNRRKLAGPTPKSKLNLRLVIMETVASLARAHARVST